MAAARFRRTVSPASDICLWSALTQDVVTVRSAADLDEAGLGAALERILAGVEAPDGEHRTVLRLPSLEPHVAPALLARGFHPSTVPGLRRLPDDGPSPSRGGVALRVARPEDRERIVDLLLAMHVADAGHAGGHRRPNDAELLGGLADEALARDEADWARPSTSLSPVAYLGLLSVAPAARRGGVGRALAARAHRRAAETGATAMLLDHAALSPLSATFWHRQGYRSLWTTWGR